MPKIIFLVIFCLLITFPIKAQDDYQLREPTTTDYLRVASEAIGGCRWDASQQFSTQPWDLCGYVLDKIETNGRDGLKDAPYELLIGAYNALQPASDWNTPGDSYVWHEALVFAWLRDNPINLDTQSEFTVADMHIGVKLHDFNADGINEYVLGIDSSRFATFFVAKRETDGTYKRVPVYLPYHDSAAPYWDYHINYLHEVAFGDFNADGLPEWFIAYDGANYHGQDLGEIYLLEWHDGEIKSIIKDPIQHIPSFKTNANDLKNDNLEYGYLFRNLDDDPALELQGVDITSDNWGCKQTNIRIYDWDVKAGGYTQLTDGVHRPDTANCVINDAENALFNQDYTAAAHLYEYARTLPLQKGNQPADSTFNLELPQYIRLRLAQAYLLNREYEAANNLLDTLAKENMASKMLSKLRDVLLTHHQAAPAETCTALYNLFEEPAIYTFNYTGFQEVIGTDLVIGMKWKFQGDFMGNGNPADPAFAGCNVPGIVDPYFKHDFYNSQDVPVKLLEGNRFKVSDYLQADFNGDGKNDWLVWYEAHVPAVILLNQGDGKPLTVLRADIPHPGKLITAVTVPLPDNTGTALVLFRAKEGLPSYFGGFSCDASAPVLGLVELWQYTENNLELIQNTSWCDDYRTVDKLFGKIGDKSVFYVRDQGKVVTYVWNTETKRYRLPTTEVASATPESTTLTPVAPITQSEQLPSNEDLYMRLGDGDMEYYQHLNQQVAETKSAADAVAILDAEIEAKYIDYPSPLQFWKATLLQRAGRIQEALAEYIALSETKPESVWGRLAAVYFEGVKKE